jgi:hypothetical protein
MNISLIRELFRWRKTPPAPLMPEELLKIELAFKKCKEEDCPLAIVINSLLLHIEWQKKHLDNSEQNYDR